MREPQLLTALDRKIEAMRRDLDKLVSLAEAQRTRAELRGWFWILMLFSAVGQVGVLGLGNLLMRH
jgi:hypothetical protein